MTFTLRVATADGHALYRCDVCAALIHRGDSAFHLAWHNDPDEPTGADTVPSHESTYTQITCRCGRTFGSGSATAAREAHEAHAAEHARHIVCAPYSHRDNA